MENQPPNSPRAGTGSGPAQQQAQPSIFAGMRYGTTTKAAAEAKVSEAEPLFLEPQEEQEQAGSQGSTHISPGSPQPESQPAASEFVPSEPIPIPGAQGATRLPVFLPGGVIAMTGSRAPVALSEVAAMHEAQAQDLVYQERYRRLKQKQMKWNAENPDQGAGAFESGEEQQDASSVEQEAGEEPAKSIIPLKGFRVGNAIMLGHDEAKAAEQQLTARLGASGAAAARVPGPPAFLLDPIDLERYERTDLIRRDGSVVGNHEVLAAVQKMMDDLQIAPFDEEEEGDPEDKKGKGVQQQQQLRPLWEMQLFLIDLERVLQQIAAEQLKQSGEKEEEGEELSENEM